MCLCSSCTCHYQSVVCVVAIICVTAFIHFKQSTYMILVKHIGSIYGTTLSVDLKVNTVRGGYVGGLTPHISQFTCIMNRKSDITKYKIIAELMFYYA